MMRSKFLFAVTVVLACVMVSCNFTENITINEDGTGSITMDMDASQLIALAGPEMLKEGQKRMDTVIHFKDVFKEKQDSIAKLPKEEQERFKKMENFSMKMLMDPEKQEFKFTMFSDYKRVDDLEDIMNAYDQVNPMNKKNSGMPDAGLDKYKTKSLYFYNGKKFKKTVSRKEELPKVKNDSIEMIMAMFESSTYTVNYKFPKKVKSVSNKKATISADKKTVTVIYPFTDYLDRPKDMSLEVEFEK